MPDDIERARSYFSKMPSEVFDLWIKPGVESYGWGVSNIGQRLDSDWQGFFSDQSLTFWTTANWQLCNMVFQPDMFASDSWQRVAWIVDNAAKGLETPTANIHNTKQRFWACASTIAKNRFLPKPLVGYLAPVKVHIVDGHHRLAAAVHLGVTHSSKLPIWIALPDAFIPAG